MYKHTHIYNKHSFFPSNGRVNIAIWMHYMDAN